MIEHLTGASTLGLSSKLKEVAKRKYGRIIADLSLGEPGATPPRELFEGLPLYQRMRYSPPAGVNELREAVAEMFSKYDVKPEEVMITVGGKSALFLAFMYLVRNGTKVIIPEPYYYSYVTVSKALGGRVKLIKMRVEKGTFKFDVGEIINEIERDSVIVINSPHNPTGAIIEGLRDVVEEAERKGARIISDEVYDVFVYEGKHESLLEHSKSFFVYSFSKCLAVPGWRIGVLIAEKEIIERLKSAAANIYGSPPLMEQVAIARAIKEGTLHKFSNELKERLYKKREKVKEKLSRLFEVHGVGPGAFYAFPLVERDGMELAERLAERGVIVSPGFIFGEDFRNAIRLSYAAPEEQIEEGLRALEEVISNS